MQLSQSMLPKLDAELALANFRKGDQLKSHELRIIAQPFETFQFCLVIFWDSLHAC